MKMIVKFEIVEEVENVEKIMKEEGKTLFEIKEDVIENNIVELLEDLATKNFSDIGEYISTTIEFNDDELKNIKIGE